MQLGIKVISNSSLRERIFSMEIVQLPCLFFFCFPSLCFVGVLRVRGCLPGQDLLPPRPQWVILSHQAFCPMGRQAVSTFLSQQWPFLTLLVEERKAERINSLLLICLWIQFRNILPRRIYQEGSHNPTLTV